MYMYPQLSCGSCLVAKEEGVHRVAATGKFSHVSKLGINIYMYLIGERMVFLYMYMYMTGHNATPPKNLDKIPKFLLHSGIKRMK